MRMLGRSRFLIAGIMVCAVAPAWAQWSGAPSPHDTAHLVVLRAADFRDTDDKPVEPKAIIGAASNKAIAALQPVGAKLRIRHAGEYVLWVRVGGPVKGPVALKGTLQQGEQEIIAATVNDGRGEIGLGGPDGFAAYAKAAQGTAPGAAVASSGLDDDPDNKGKKVADDLAAEFAAELAADSGEEQKINWITGQRLEEPSETQPFYWWKLGAAELEPGEYTLRLEPVGKFKADRAPLVDIAFASTADDLAYPFLPEIDVPKASFIRFRIDQKPAKGLTIGASLRLHYDPWSTGAVWLNPNAMSPTRSEPHKRTGYTRWYRLQDIERVPPFGPAEVQLQLQVGAAGGTSEGCAGATQFAVIPHQDYVLREIDWAEPDGLSVSMAPDFETYLHQLRTLRDHAREDYDRARRVTQGRVYPLTRDGLYFGNAWGAATGHQHEYMVKTFRHLGFNCVGEAEDAIRSRQLYGWTSHAGQYWPEAHLPFDEEESRKLYDADFRDAFKAQRELFEGVSVYQLADEPGEIQRTEMSSPLWRYSTSSGGKESTADKPVERWTDATGDSHLHTRKNDYQNCVLEGKIEQLAGWVGFRVAVDDGEQPRKFAYWHIGRVSQNMEVNLLVGREGVKPAEVAGVTRRSAVIGPKLTPFKIIYDGSQAALYLNGQLVHQHIDLPKSGGFGIVGGSKSLSELRFRPLKKNERLTEATGDGDLADSGQKKPQDDLDVDDLLGDSAETPDWAEPKPLERLVREDFVTGGGVPGAHEAFRRWAAEQGQTPQTFGQQTWDDVHMLTVPKLVTSPEEARLFYWSRRFSGWLTPKMFSMSADAIRQHAPNKQMLSFVALSGHSLYFPRETPLDMFQLAGDSPAMTPGISDWMSYGGWRWDSHQAVAFSIAPYNAGARRYGESPLNHPMMHCVWPGELRAMTMLANNCRYISFYNFGPSYAVTEGYWNEAEDCHRTVHRAANRAAQCDDILTQAAMRPSRVAMLYAMSNEYWNAQSSFADKRAAFLALSHEGFQPELVTEEQVLAGALAHYDALYVLDPVVAGDVQDHIAGWVKQGGLLWACADALTKNEFNEPRDLLAESDVCTRTFSPADAKPSNAEAPRFVPVKGGDAFRPHTVATQGLPQKVQPAKAAQIRGKYDDGRPAWLTQKVGQGHVVYLAHRAGLTYTALAARLGGYEALWADTGRDMLTLPLKAAQVERELIVSEPVVMAAPLSSEAGTVIVLYNMRPEPLKNVRLSLKEQAKPHGVETFDDLQLQPLEFTFKNGRVEFELPELATGQMVVVRRQSAPADDRLEAMEARTRQQLKSNDWRALSAGAFFAGTHPEWKLADLVAPLLSHSRWQVRQAAVEALGRIGEEASSDAILENLTAETDAHVIGDSLVALAQLRHERTAELCLTHASHAQPFVRRQAIAATLEFYPLPSRERAVGRQAEASQHVAAQPPGEGAARSTFSSEQLSALIDLALADTDLRVRREGIKLLATTAPQRAAELAHTAFLPGGRDPQERATWAESITSNDAAFEAVMQHPSRAGDDLLLALAGQRADPRLAALLADMADDFSPEQAPVFIAAAIRQRDPALAAALLERRETLNKIVAAYLPLILEHAYDARLGNVVADWERFLADHATAVTQ